MSGIKSSHLRTSRRFLVMLDKVIDTMHVINSLSIVT